MEEYCSDVKSGRILDQTLKNGRTLTQILKIRVTRDETLKIISKNVRILKTEK